MRAGKLRHRITIDQLGEVQDPNTGVITEGWATFREDIPAEIKPMSGTEILKADAAQSESRVRFVIRYDAGVGIDTKMRITHEALHYNITEIVADPTLRRHFTLIATAGLRDG